MVDNSLVRHWAGMSKEDIISYWKPENRHKSDNVEEYIQERQNDLETKIVASFRAKAKEGDVAAFEWLEDHCLIPSPDWQQRDEFVMLRAIARRAESGDIDAVTWLGERGHIFQTPSG